MPEKYKKHTCDPKKIKVFDKKRMFDITSEDYGLTWEVNDENTYPIVFCLYCGKELIEEFDKDIIELVKKRWCKNE